jgi:predicted O-methyltransferase YrrM
LFHQIITYIKWFPKTFHLHGIHSPFVFSFQKKCLKNKAKKDTDQIIIAYRKALSQNDQTILVTDFGAGSRVFTSNERKVKDIARYAGASLKRMQSIQRVVQYFKPKNILEIGTSLGMGTIALASSPDTQVISLEGCPETAAIAKKQLHDFHVSNVEIIIGEFSESIKKLPKKKYDLIYFDGNHSKEATLQYAQDLLPTITNETVWIFDDIHWSSEMTEAWKAIQKIPEVTATIDSFWLGFVFFRKEQNKEHFSVFI